MFWTAGGVTRILAGGKVVLPLLIAFGIALSASVARGESPQDGQCRNALNSFIASGWNTERLTPLDPCPDDIRLYISYLASIRVDGSDENVRKQQQTLRAAAEAGNRSAQLLYTLLFTKITDSKFIAEIVNESFYSRYSSYVRTWHVLMKVPDMTKYQAGPAAEGGVAEVYLPLHIATYLEWRHGKWPNDRISAAVDLLIAADFYADRDTVRPYLRRLLSLNDTELEDAELYASLRVGDILISKEMYHCQLDKRCAADSNIKRLICDVRTPKGDFFLKLDGEICDRLSAPLARLYRSSVKDLITAIISLG